MKEITVVLTGYKRDYFKEQLSSIKSQKGVDIKDIILWQNEDHVDLSYLRSEGVKIVKSDINFKFHGRFTLPLLFETEWTVIFDDDTVPGDEWLQNAIRCSEEHNCISGANGRWYLGDSKNKGIADAGFCPKDTKVDYVGHSWVFKTEWVKYMWMEKTYTYDNGEDMQFCLSAKIFGDIDSYVPRQDNPNISSSRNSSFGMDKHASYKLNDHKPVRGEIFEYWEGKGYKRILK